MQGHAFRTSWPLIVALSALAGIVLGAAVWPGGGTGASSSPPPDRDPRAVVARDVTEALEKDDHVRVIVTLAAKPRLHAGPVRQPDIVALTAASQVQVLARIPSSEFRVTRRYEAVPALAGTATARGVDALAQDPGVAHVALDVTLQADLAEAVPLINADDVHSSLGRTGEGVTVAVLDTGIDTDHPMLSDDFVYQACFLVESTCPGGGTTGTSAEDGHGHGTHVSGIVTLAGPPVGIAPDASIEAYKVLQNTGSGSFSNVLSAYDDIIVNHPEVDLINMSVSNGGSYAPNGCDGLIPAFTTAVATTRAMGITTFASAGNSSSKTGIGFPACVGDVVAVGAVYDADVGSQAFGACSDPSTAPDQVTCFSQSHPSLDLLAPGARIQSAGIGGGLATLSGTSMSSPAAAAAAALLLESEPALMPADLEARLRETGVPVTDAANNVTSCRVDAYEAVVDDGGPVCSPSGPPPPANDDFADAVAAGEPLPYGNAQTTAFATTEVGEPSPCGGIASTVWYSFTPTSNAPIEVSTVGSNYDTVLAVYSGPSLDSLALAGCNDDFSLLQSQVQFTANAGTTYSIQAGGFLGAAGDLQLTIGVAAPTPTPTGTPTATPTKQPPPGDTDGDGCTDQEENGPNEALGGRRSFLNPWDLYDVNGDGTVDLFVDVFGVAGTFGQGPGGPDYSTGKDRSPPPSEAEEPDPDKREPWDMGPPDAMIDLFVDIFGVALQFGHECASPP